MYVNAPQDPPALRLDSRAVTRPPAPARQARSKQTIERVLAAAEELFAEAGPTGFTIPAVSHRAGVSVALIYRRFATKEDLLIAVLQRVAEQEESTIFESWETENWTIIDSRTMIARLIGDLSRTWRDRAPLMRAMMARRLQLHDDAVFDHGRGVTAHHAPPFKRVVLTHAAEIVHSNPDEAIDFAFRVIISLCGRWTAQTVETLAPTRMEWDEMLDQASDMITTYLFGRPARGTSSRDSQHKPGSHALTP